MQWSGSYSCVVAAVLIFFLGVANKHNDIFYLNFHGGFTLANFPRLADQSTFTLVYLLSSQSLLGILLKNSIYKQGDITGLHICLAAAFYLLEISQTTPYFSYFQYLLLQQGLIVWSTLWAFYLQYSGGKTVVTSTVLQTFYSFRLTIVALLSLDQRSYFHACAHRNADILSKIYFQEQLVWYKLLRVLSGTDTL